jgi:RNA polymerase-binding transcription factor
MAELTAAQLNALRDQLRELEQEIEHLLKNSSAGARPVALDQPIGRLSRMDALQQQSMVKANRSAAQRQLELVLAALRRMQTGDYGNCLGCEEPIPYQRLQVKPESPFCLGCQRDAEQR